jgi:hypothetical protein
MVLKQHIPYGHISNTRDSSVSNNSNPIGSSSLAAYTSVNNAANKKLGMMNNFMPSNLAQQFYNVGSVEGSGGNYNYEINLNAVNKTGGP